jgi:hypothetical protein
MKVTPVEHGLDLLKSDLVRSPGLHASTIYGELFKELEPKRYDIRDKTTGEPIPPNYLLWALGTAWERHFEHLLTLNGVEYERPDEFLSDDGVAFSPDLLIMWKGVLRLGEIKYTSMGAQDMPTEETNCLPPKLDKFDCQLKLYAYWLGMHDGLLAVVFNNHPWDPELRLFEITWTDRELVDNHTMCMNFAKHKGLL